jgi:hypothetical protein
VSESTPLVGKQMKFCGSSQTYPENFQVLELGKKRAESISFLLFCRFLKSPNNDSLRFIMKTETAEM